MLFADGYLCTDMFSDVRVVQVFQDAYARRSGPIRPADLLTAAIRLDDSAILTALSGFSRNGCERDEILLLANTKSDGGFMFRKISTKRVGRLAFSASAFSSVG